MRLLVLASVLSFCEAVNVLIFIPGTREWEKKPFMRIAQDITFRNHGTETFKGIIIPEQRYLVKQKVHGARELSMNMGLDKSLYQAVEQMGNHVFGQEYESLYYAMPEWTAHVNACDTLINSDIMQRFREDKIDVALVYSGNPCNLAVVWSLNIPFIYFDTEGLSDETAAAAGMLVDPLRFPSSYSTFGPEMNFLERCLNVALYAREWLAQEAPSWLANFANPRVRNLDEPTAQLFRDDYELSKSQPHLPSVSAMLSDAEAYFVNSDPVVEWCGRPAAPNLVYVGGYAAEYPKPLFPPYNTTNARAPNGVILFSLGTVANSTAMPDYWRTAFLSAFRRLSDYQVYWLTTEVEPEEDFPPNVNRTLFFPQVDLLAAEETRLLMTNGGMDSIMEAVTYAVPILGIPLYGPNYNSLRKVEAKGMAKILDKAELSEDSLYTAIKEVLETKKYRQSAVQLARAIKDRTLSPYESLLYWMETVGRNRGSPLRRMEKEPKVSMIRVLYLDVILAALLLFYLSRYLLGKLWAALSRCCGKGGVPMPQAPKGQKRKTAKRD